MDKYQAAYAKRLEKLNGDPSPKTIARLSAWDAFLTRSTSSKTWNTSYRTLRTSTMNSRMRRATLASKNSNERSIMNPSKFTI